MKICNKNDIIIVFIFALLFQTKLSRAQESKNRDGFFLHIGAGIELFSQESDWPPICCGERDSWTVIGPQFNLRPGWYFGRFLMVDAELDYAFVVYEDELQFYKMHRLNGVFGVDFVFPPNGPIFFTLGIGASIGHVSGTFQNGPYTEHVYMNSPEGLLWGCQPRVGMDIFGPFGRDWALGVEVTFTKYFFSENSWTIGLYGTWHSIWSKHRHSVSQQNSAY